MGPPDPPDPARVGREDHWHVAGDGQLGAAPPAGEPGGARGQDPGGFAGAGGAQRVFRQVRLRRITNGVPYGLYCTVLKNQGHGGCISFLSLMFSLQYVPCYRKRKGKTRKSRKRIKLEI